MAEEEERQQLVGQLVQLVGQLVGQLGQLVSQLVGSPARRRCLVSRDQPAEYGGEEASPVR